MLKSTRLVVKLGC